MRPRLPIPPWIAILSLLLALAAGGCEWGLGLGTGDFDRDLRGRYHGTFAIEWDGARGGWDEGPGEILLERSFGGSRFEGRWEWRLAGRRFRGDLEDGRARAFGDISFALETFGGRDLLEGITDCRFVSGDRRFHGEVHGRFLRADRIARLRCRDPFTGFRDEVRVRVSFRGRR